MGLDKLANTFAEILKAPPKDTKPYDTEAEVTRIDDNGRIAWVHIPGGIDETPVELTIAAKKGDRVKVRVSGGRAWIAGNGSAPPTDNTVANRAYIRANSAVNEAVEAKESAAIAKEAADEAKQSASDANYYANGALTSLSVVEDVVGTLNWISQHGTYSLTTDTAIDPDKIYFVYNSGTYTPVIDPKVEDLSTYYELNLDSTMQTYISSHLALTNEGLWVVKDNQAYKILLSNTGLRVYDASGNVVSTFGQNVSFSSNVPQTIGSEAAKISFNPTNGQITISGNVIFSNVEAIQDLQDQIDGRKTNWYYEVDPEDNTDPALIWTTDEEKERHVGDLYYNTSNGHCWRWLKTTEGGVTTYSWSQIQDSDAAEAKSIAEAAAKETQLIYTQSADATGHISLPTAWVAEYDEPNTTTPVHWTRKRPTYKTAYPVTWVATQIRSMKGDITILNNTAYMDDTLTVIDGGHILAGSIDASRINVQNLITAGDLIVGGDNLSELTDDIGIQTSQDVEEAIAATSVEELSDGSDYTKKANAISSTVSIYYRKNSVNPQTPPSSIGTAVDTDDAWEYVMPVPKRNRTFYTCERYTYADGSISYSTIRELSSETYASKWVHSADSAYIDGGKLYAESVTADRLAANAITIGKMDSEAKNAVTNSKVYTIGVNNGTAGYHFLGTLTLSGQTDEAEIEIHTGDGQNNLARQNLTIYVNIKRGWQPTTAATAGITVQYDGDPTIITMAESNCKIIVRCTEIGVMNVYLHTPTWNYADGWYQVKGRNFSWVHSGTLVTTEPSEGTAQSITSTNPYTTATSYITKITGEGIFISPEDQSPSEQTPGNSVKIDGTGMEVFKDDVSMAKYGETVRIGQEQSARTEINKDDMLLITEDGVRSLNIHDSGIQQENYRHVSVGVVLNNGESHSITFSDIPNGTPLEFFLVNGGPPLMLLIDIVIGTSSSREYTTGYVLCSYNYDAATNTISIRANQDNVSIRYYEYLSMVNMPYIDMEGSPRLYCGTASDTDTDDYWFHQGLVDGNLYMSCVTDSTDHYINLKRLLAALAGNYLRYSSFQQTSHVLLNSRELEGYGYVSGTLNLSKSPGLWTPIMVSGWHSSNKFFSLNRCYISEYTGSDPDVDGVLNYLIYNPSANAHSGTVRVYVTWIRTLGYDVPRPSRSANS